MIHEVVVVLELDDASWWSLVSVRCRLESWLIVSSLIEDAVAVVVVVGVEDAAGRFIDGDRSNELLAQLNRSALDWLTDRLADRCEQAQASRMRSEVWAAQRHEEDGKPIDDRWTRPSCPRVRTMLDRLCRECPRCHTLLWSPMA